MGILDCPSLVFEAGRWCSFARWTEFGRLPSGAQCKSLTLEPRHAFLDGQSKDVAYNVNSSAHLAHLFFSGHGVTLHSRKASHGAELAY
jgi:hypothetical protein